MGSTVDTSESNIPLVLAYSLTTQLLTNTTQLWEVALIGLNNLATLSTPVLASLHRHPSLLSALRISSRLHASPAFLIGAALVCSGAYLRRACFARLGAQFTFELSVQKDHRLVTDGPYAVVRHPSYGAALMQAVGLMVCLAAPGGWWAEAGLWHSGAGKALTLLVCGFMTLCTVGGIDRTFKEDAIMRRMFGAQWDEWAKRTPYRMIPYVF